jgi:hypothetical protein
MKKFLYFLLILLFSESTSICQKVESFTARDVAVAIYQKQNLVKDVQVKSLIPIGLNNDTLLYVVTFAEKGFVIVSGYRSAPPVLGQCFTDVYDTNRMPPGLLYLIEKYKYGISKLKESKVIPSKEIEKKWKNILSSGFSSSKSYTVGNHLVQTEWNQTGGYAYYATEEHPNGCTGVAMAQILHYWGCRVDGQLHDYMWADMDLYSPDLDNALLIHDCSLACQTTEGGSSTPGKARDGFVDYFGISNSADVKWRIWHLSNWDEMLVDEIDLERPILYSAGNFSFEGHSWVIDGYDEYGNFHCNWGWSGNYNGFYSLGGFDPGGQGPFNEIESAIFNVAPNQTSIVGPSYVCYSGTEFSLINVPSGSTINWTTSANLTVQSGQGTTNPTISSVNQYVSEGWVQANVYCDDNIIPQKNVMANPPHYYDISFSVYDQYYQEVDPWQLCPNTNYEIHVDYNNNYQCYLSDYNFNLPSGFSTNWTYNNMIGINTNYSSGGYTTVDANTCCGFKEVLTGYMVVAGECGGYYMSFSPNPSTGETTLEIKTNETKAFDENTQWDMEIYNMMQTLKTSTRNLKGSTTRINVSDWNEGIYLVRVKMKDKWISGKLIVNH